MKIELLLGIWGSVTGTVAIGFQAWEALADRARLRIEGGVSINHTDQLRIMLRVAVVNIGRRPVRIKEIAVFLSPEATPVAEGLPPEAVEQLRRTESLMKPVSRKLCHSPSHGQQPTELAPDGGEYEWLVPIPPNTRFLSSSELGREHGDGYVLLTSGKRCRFRFTLLSPGDWPPMNIGPKPSF